MRYRRHGDRGVGTLRRKWPPFYLFDERARERQRGKSWRKGRKEGKRRKSGKKERKEGWMDDLRK